MYPPIGNYKVDMSIISPDGEIDVYIRSYGPDVVADVMRRVLRGDVLIYDVARKAWHPKQGQSDTRIYAAYSTGDIDAVPHDAFAFVDFRE